MPQVGQLVREQGSNLRHVTASRVVRHGAVINRLGAIVAGCIGWTTERQRGQQNYGDGYVEVVPCAAGKAKRKERIEHETDDGISGRD